VVGSSVFLVIYEPDRGAQHIVGAYATAKAAWEALKAEAKRYGRPLHDYSTQEEFVHGEQVERAATLEEAKAREAHAVADLKRAVEDLV
jgi:hypothetical protein